jgi:hypothetical protein
VANRSPPVFNCREQDDASRQGAIRAGLGEQLWRVALAGRLTRGATDGPPARDVQLGRKEGTARPPRVFRKALDADMAHFLWLANVFL